MSSHARLVIVATVLLCCVCSSSQVHSQTKPKKDSAATVSGRVTIKGKPAPGVVVGLRLTQPDEASPTFKATTDQEGHYHVNNVPTGSYQVWPVAPAFVVSGANDPRGQTVIITGADNIEGIDFDLMRGGVITGRVTDANGDPVIEERVILSPATDQRTQRPPDYSASSQTDDRGIYRTFGIRPGRYKVSVGEGENGGFRTFGRGRPLLVETFYRDPTDPDKAGVVEIEEGTEATKIDITVGAAVQGFSATGQVVDEETAKPIPNVQVNLTRVVTTDTNNTRSYGGVGVSTDTQGEFRMQNLRPGKYEVSVYSNSDSDLRIEQPVSFDIVDQDVTGLVIKTAKGASLTGIVVFEGIKDMAADSLLGRVWISAYTRDESNPRMTSGRAGSLRPDGSFHIGGLMPGIVNFSVETRGPRRLTISRVERDGVVLPSGIQIQNTEQVTGIRLVVSYNSGSIRGVVKIENGNLPPGARLVLQVSKSGDPNIASPGSQVDARGHFLIEGLAAGSYQLSVVAYIPGLRQRPPTATQIVNVADGAATDVILILDLTPIPNP